jgi:hypothetical protein
MKFVLELELEKQDYCLIGRAVEAIGREIGSDIPIEPKIGDTSPLFDSEKQVGLWRIVAS